MCDQEASLVSQGFNAVGSAIGAFNQKRGQQSVYEANAKISDINARLSELTAQSTIKAGARAEQASRLKTAAMVASQKTGYAGRGIALDSRTVSRVQKSTEALGDIDATEIRMNAMRQAFGHRMSGVNFQTSAVGNQAVADSIDPFGAASSTLLTGATQVAANRYKFQQAGILPKDDWFSRNVYGGPDAIF
jgi:hypothetical protein